MAQNKVEYHIQEGGFFTFKVNAGEVVKIGQIVEIKGDRVVGLAGAGSQKVIGVVYSGTVGIDGINVGYSGDNGDVATVVVLKPLVYLTAGGAVSAGDPLKSDANGNAVTATVGTDATEAIFGMAITGAGASGEDFVAVLK